jgi:uncharacterized membrane protein
MGPIIGIGVSLATYDVRLLKKSSKNFGVAVIISVLTSALYYTVSPLKEPQSELIARTSPTLWDVLIAFFGGLAGIIASTSRVKKFTVIANVFLVVRFILAAFDWFDTPQRCTILVGLTHSKELSKLPP